MTHITTEQKSKYHELIKYICARVQTGSDLSKTKLFKILFFCDFTAYRELGQSITGDGYIRLPYGSVPTHGNKAITEMLESNELAVAHTYYGGHAGKKFVTITPIDLSVFSPQEVALIDAQIERFKKRTAGSLSELSHEFIGWQITENGQNIPYGTSLLQDDEDIDFQLPQEYMDDALHNAKEEFAKHS